MFKPRLNHQKYLLIALALLAVLTFSGATASTVWALTSTPSQDAATPIQVQVKMGRLPLTGQASTVSCVANTAMAAPNTTVQFKLPAGAQIVSGMGRWTGDLKPGAPVTLTASVRFSQAGNNQVACSALRQIDAVNSWGDLGTVYFTLGATESKPGYAPQLNEQVSYAGDGEGQPVKVTFDEATLQASMSNLPAAPAVTPALNDQMVQPAEVVPNAVLTVTGTWKYYTRTDAYVGANQFQAELVRGTSPFTHLAWCATSTTGTYSCPSATNPGSAGIIVRLYSYIKYTPYSDVLQVTNGYGTGLGNVYTVWTNKYIFSNGTHSVGTWYIINGASVERAFWSKDDLDRAWKYVWFKTGSTQVPKETAGPSTIYWRADSTDGTYYNLGGQIHLKGEDPLSHDTAIHEYAHNIMWEQYGHWFPTSYCPSPHYINAWSHKNCAWTEGFADYFPLAVNNSPVYHWADGYGLNMETPTWGTADWGNGEGVEGRVAGALWDMTDAVNDGTDTYTGTFANVWDTFYHQNDNQFVEFWAAWRARGHGVTPVWAIYQNTIDYRVPAIPTLYSPASGADLTNHTIGVVWYQTARATSYKVQVRYGSTTGTLLVNATTANTSYTKAYTNHGYYYWHVAACNAYGCSAYGPWRYFHLNP